MISKPPRGARMTSKPLWRRGAPPARSARAAGESPQALGADAVVRQDCHALPTGTHPSRARPKRVPASHPAENCRSMPRRNDYVQVSGVNAGSRGRRVPCAGVRARCPGGNDTPGTSAFASAKSLAGTPACVPGFSGGAAGVRGRFHDGGEPLRGAPCGIAVRAPSGFFGRVAVGGGGAADPGRALGGLAV